MKKHLFFIAIISLGLGIIIFQNISPSHLQGSAFIETENIYIRPFSIEPTLADQTISIVFGGKITLQTENNFIIPSFLANIFSKQDSVLLHLQNQIFDKNITNIAGDPIIEKTFLTDLFASNISHLTVISNSLFSRGKFFADLTFGNIMESEIIPITSGNPQYFHKGNLSVMILSWNAQRENTKEFLGFLSSHSSQEKDYFIIVVTDFNSPTATNISQSEKNIAYSLIENGANIVIGVGNNNILPIEKYNEQLIFYSLGTFYSDTTKKSGILTEILISPENKKLYIHPFQFHNNIFTFFNKIETLEFFSNTGIFLGFEKNERKNLFNEKKIDID